MNQEVKKLWVEALRSGEYKQAQGQLQVSDVGFCCLGVLCDLYVKNGHAEWTTKSTSSIRDREISISQSSLPIMVQKWAGLIWTDPTIEVLDIDSEIGSVGYDISYLNDNLDWDFNRIAAAIEAQL